MTAHAGPLTGSTATRPSPGATGERRLATRVLLGSRADPAWVRPSLWGLLVATGLLYIVGLSASGTANSFYAAAVQAGSQSWKALFFGSLDSSNFITVDKPPASLWVMGISARIFGFNSWSLLVPQALMGVGSVALVFAIVRRSLAALGPRLSAAGALVGGLALACTPAAALMFRFDNPDALLVLLMTLAAHFVVRALPKASWKWLAAAGLVLGFAFLTKMLQGLLVAPAFVLVYLLAANTTIWKRLLHVLGALVGVVVGAGWWVAIVAIWPADSRPYIGGSTNNSVLELAFGYNGLGRFFGSGSGNGGGGGAGGGTAGGSFGGSTGLTRLFSSEMGLEISWLLPAALLLLVLGLIVAGRRSRLDPLRAGLVMWGGWLIVTALVFSFTSGTIHPYYTIALAPAIAGIIGIGGALLWRMRTTWLGRLGLAVAIAGTGAWSFHLLSENATWMPWLKWVVLIGSVLATLGFVFGSIAAFRRVTLAAVLVGTLFAFGGSGAYAVATASVGHSGSIPSVGSSSSSSGMGGGGMGGGTGGGAGGAGGGGTPPSGTGGPGGSESGEMPSGGSGSGDAPTGEMPSGTAPGGSSSGGTDSGSSSTSDDSASGGSSSSSAGMGGTTSSTALDTLLKKSTARWAAAVNNDQSAATLELSSGTAVMAIGGWSDDPTPTLAEFKAYVAAGDIGYYVSSGSGGGMGGGSSSTSSAIKTWVEANFTATTVGGSTVYDLSAAK